MTEKKTLAEIKTMLKIPEREAEKKKKKADERAKKRADERAKKQRGMKMSEIKILEKIVEKSPYHSLGPEKLEDGSYALLVENPQDCIPIPFYTIQEFEMSAEDLLGKVDQTEDKLK